jgi:hypothetical protein
LEAAHSNKRANRNLGWLSDFYVAAEQFILRVLWPKPEILKSN